MSLILKKIGITKYFLIGGIFSYFPYNLGIVPLVLTAALCQKSSFCSKDEYDEIADGFFIFNSVDALKTVYQGGGFSIVSRIKDFTFDDALLGKVKDLTVDLAKELYAPFVLEVTTLGSVALANAMHECNSTWN